MYKKATHADLYLNAIRCYHPAQKRAVLNTLVHHRVLFSIADSDSLEQELEHLHTVFLMNSFKINDIQYVIHKFCVGIHNKSNTQQEEELKSVILPYCGAISPHIDTLSTNGLFTRW